MLNVHVSTCLNLLRGSSLTKALKSVDYSIPQDLYIHLFQNGVVNTAKSVRALHFHPFLMNWMSHMFIRSNLHSTIDQAFCSFINNYNKKLIRGQSEPLKN